MRILTITEKVYFFSTSNFWGYKDEIDNLVDCDLGSGIGTHPTLKNPVSSAENTDELLLTEAEETAEEMNIESLAGMLDDLYNGETLPVSRLSELDVALEMDEVEIVEEEPLDDNESDSDADVDHGGGVSEYEL